MISDEINRIGFHYYPDTLHYRAQDLQMWLPELRLLGASWITLMASAQRAIPEPFLTGLLNAGVQPILHFSMPIHVAVSQVDLKALFNNYAHWGMRYIALYDRPNTRQSWSPTAWTQSDLVDRFLDMFLPLAESALDAGLIPIFPPLEPGGDYWDLAFLRTALRSIKRRGHSRLIEKLVLGAYAWIGDHPLNWGEGGADRWPGARPYSTPPGVQDQRGFRIFDWYLSIAEDELGCSLPMILLRAGALPGEAWQPGAPRSRGQQHADLNLAAARLMSGDPEKDQPAQLVPTQVLACNFWLLASDEDSKFASHAWFQPNGDRLPVVDAFRRWAARSQIQTEEQNIDVGNAKSSIKMSLPTPEPVLCNENPEPALASAGATQPPVRRLIGHYILLPTYAWGAADWDLEAIQPFLADSHPTVGFSLAEACLAERVTVVGGPGAISDSALKMLRSAGCQVERLREDGTIVATSG